MTKSGRNFLYKLTGTLVFALIAAGCSHKSNSNVNAQTAGPSCTVTQTADGATIECPDGTTAVINNGQSGLNGNDGSSCSVYSVDQGAVIQCTDGTTALVKNGEDGQDAPSSIYSIVDVIDPCGTQTRFDEVILRFADGELLAHYSDGDKQHFSFVGPGQYVTTDGTNCHFQVTEDGDVVW